MPLELHDASFEMPKRICWDIHSEVEREEAKRKIRELSDEGYRISDIEVGEIVCVPPERDEDSVLVRVVDESGDSRLIWNRHILAEIKEAKKRFLDYIAKGYRAYVCRSDGKRGARLESFDELMEEILLEKGSEGLMLPPTYPG